MTPNVHDDQYNFDPTQYQMPGAQILPQPGEYAVRLGSLMRAKDKNTGQELLTDGVFPTLIVNSVEIVEPQEEAGKFRLNWHRIGTKPFPRKGSGGNVLASAMMDVLFAIDPTLPSQCEGSTPAEKWADAIRLAEAELKSGAIVHVKLGFRATDIEQAKADIDNGVEKNAAYRKNTYYNKAFRNATGGYNTTVVTPGGRTLQAELTIDSFVAVADRTTQPGPFGRKK